MSGKAAVQNPAYLRTFADVTWQGTTFRTEYSWINADLLAAPLIVFLHQGLGSVSMWIDFATRLCNTGKFRGLAFSRYGYGSSTPRPASERWDTDQLHHQAEEFLPAFLRAVGVGGHERPWLLGHSDGGTIALIHAARYPDASKSIIVLAPHIFLEQVTLDSVMKAKADYEEGPLRKPLSRYHADVDSAFHGWADMWLNPASRDWTIEALLSRIRVPVLAVQGELDQYGTMAQIDGIKRAANQTELIKLADCGHVPYRDRPEILDRAVIDFIDAAHR